MYFIIATWFLIDGTALILSKKYRLRRAEWLGNLDNEIPSKHGIGGTRDE